MAHMRILTIVMAAVMLLTSLMVPVSAADDNKHTAVFGTKSLPLAQYDPGKGTSAFTKNGKLCAKRRQPSHRANLSSLPRTGSADILCYSYEG